MLCYCNAEFMLTGMGVPGMNAMNSYIGAAAGHRQFNNNIFGGMPVQQPQQNQSAEMVIPNELIGCIIGRSGAKIKEIRFETVDYSYSDHRLILSGLKHV